MSRASRGRREVPSSVREVRGWERRAVIELVEVGCWDGWETSSVLDWGREAGSAGGVRGPAGEAMLMRKMLSREVMSAQMRR